MDELAYFHAIPKAELHLHLDGALRPKTVLELAKAGGVPLPTSDLEKLKDFLEATDRTASLVEYIEYFQLPIAVLQSVPTLERATYELCEDLSVSDKAGDEWLATAKKLSEKVRHHLKEEEKKFFKVAGRILTDAQKETLAVPACAVVILKVRYACWPTVKRVTESMGR